ncbi:siderophore ABC transporter substrate-binding protein [Pelistega ratti]|uniref:siderophore ABC transporter substrate-binding protein n=1 Tax=Pelistega ratti TaxID=2652177 RepID=UPI00135AE25F|nr:siderophore ABC transporter substrate-binding protein [Pelistega ratti]
MKKWFNILLVMVSMAIAGQSLAMTIQTAKGEVNINQPLSNNVAVFELSALDTLSALGVYPKGTPEVVELDYLKPVFEAGTTVGTLFEPDLEKLNALQPEGIIIGGRMSPKYAEISKVAPVFDMTNTGTDIARAQTLLKEYGKLFGKEEQAAELSKKLDLALQQTQDIIKNQGKALMIMVNGNKVASFGVKSRFGYLFNDFGWEPADNNQSDARHGSPVSFEFIRDMDPDWIIVMDRNAAIGAKGESAKAVLDNALLKDIKAFKNNHIIYLDSSSYLASGGYQQMMRELKLLRDAVSQ